MSDNYEYGDGDGDGDENGGGGFDGGYGGNEDNEDYAQDDGNQNYDQNNEDNDGQEAQEDQEDPGDQDEDADEQDEDAEEDVENADGQDDKQQDENEDRDEYSNVVQEDEEDDGSEQVTAVETNAADPGEAHGMGTLIKGAMDGFGGGGFDGVVGEIGNLISSGGGGGLSNIFSSGGMEGIVENMIGGAAHRFLGIDSATGAIIGAIAGNLIFNMGGQNNSLSSIGKVILDNIISGKFRRDVHPFTPGGPTPTTGDFSLDFARERQRCLDQKVLFEDPQFPASSRSLYYKTPPDGNVEWKRPGEIVDTPQLIVGQQSRFDVKQGALGDCWLLAAVANLTLRDELFYRVVPPDQSFTENYCGIFHFQFWRYGRWVDVVVDDRLPTIDGRLCYMHSHDNSAFWSALLEKAYAKLYGCYENLDGGATTEALEDFTGGLTEYFDLRKADKATTLAMMVRGMQMGSLFGCSIDADANVREAQLNNGLVCGHAYSITSLHTSNNTPLVRIRNPWGNSKEWNGAWSDGSSEWNHVDDATKQSMGVQFGKDGEFWMSFDDFFVNFTQMEVCNLSAAVMDEISEMTGVNVADAQQHRWEEKHEDGEWSSSRGTAGGCNNNPESYYCNPQYASQFSVPEASVENDGKCTVIVAVLQKNRREMRPSGGDSLPIGFAVYPCNGRSGPFDERFFESTRPASRTKTFINLREVTCRFRVPPGDYLIVPCTYEPNSDGQFLLRIFANVQLRTEPLR